MQPEKQMQSHSVVLPDKKLQKMYFNAVGSSASVLTFNFNDNLLRFYTVDELVSLVNLNSNVNWPLILPCEDIRTKCEQNGPQLNLQGLTVTRSASQA